MGELWVAWPLSTMAAMAEEAARLKGATSDAKPGSLLAELLSKPDDETQFARVPTLFSQRALAFGVKHRLLSIAL